MTVPPVMCAQAVRERVMSMVVEASRPVLYWSSRMTRAFVTSCSKAVYGLLEERESS